MTSASSVVSSVVSSGALSAGSAAISSAGSVTASSGSSASGVSAVSGSLGFSLRQVGRSELRYALFKAFVTLLVYLVVLALDCRELSSGMCFLAKAKKEAGYCVGAVCALEIGDKGNPADNRLGLGVEFGDDCHFSPCRREPCMGHGRSDPRPRNAPAKR